MNRICLLIASGALCAAFAQSPDTRPEFEVASIKPSPPQVQNTASVGVHIDGAQFRCNYFAVLDYVRVAYRLKTNQLAGPDWMSTDRFDISAKIPEGVKAEMVPEMLQRLLEDRFGLKFHRETRDLPVYGLVQAKSGLKLKPIAEDPAEPAPRTFDVEAQGGAGGVSVKYPGGAFFELANNKFTVKKMTLSQFADVLSRFTDREVIDQANAPGRYDFVVEMTQEDYYALLIRSAVRAGVSLPPEAMRLMQGVSGESLFQSLESVGLKIDARKAPVEVLVIDQALKTPKAD